MRLANSGQEKDSPAALPANPATHACLPASERTANRRTKRRHGWRHAGDQAPTALSSPSNAAPGDQCFSVSGKIKLRRARLLVNFFPQREQTGNISRQQRSNLEKQGAFFGSSKVICSPDNRRVLVAEIADGDLGLNRNNRRSRIPAGAR